MKCDAHVRQSGLANRGSKAFIIHALLVLFAISGCVYAASSPAQISQGHAGEIPLARFLLTNRKATSSALPKLTLERNAKTQVVSTCRGFIKNIATWNVQEGVNNMRYLADYQSCVAHYIFRDGKSSVRSLYHRDFDSLVMNSLDLSSFPSSLHNRLDANKNTLKSLGLSASVKSNTAVLVKLKDWTYRFDLLAKGDFTHDGNEDLLVRFIDEARKGNYFSVETLVLSKTHRPALWQAITGIDFIRHRKKMAPARQ